MKIKCDFCQTEYSVDRVSGRVECAVCGNTWVVRRPPRRRNVFLLFLAAVTALLSACVFAIAVVARDRARDVAMHPLVAQISALTAEDGDASRMRVSGTIVNRSDQIYGVPWLIISMVDDAGHVISRGRFMPPATLLDAGASANFSHVVDIVAGVKTVTVELQGDVK